MELPAMEKERKTPDQIAKDFLVKIEKDEKAKQVEEKVEAKGATEVIPEEKKTEETKEPEANSDEKKPEETKGDKVALRKAEIQKEIDALIAQKKTLENEVGEVSKAKEKIAQLEREKTLLPKPKAEVAIDPVKVEQARVEQYLKEDAAKPRVERREMSNEEWDEWYLENPREATRWETRQDRRRERERDEDKQKVLIQEKASEFLAKQEESRMKLIAKFPQVQIGDRANALIAQGKTKEEVHQILLADNKYYKLCHEIATSDPKYVESIDGPELVMKEMEKRLDSESSTPKSKKTYSAEEVEQIRKEAAEEERNRLAGLDVGVGSTRGHETPKTVTEFEKRQIEIARKAGMTEEELRKFKVRRAKIVGSESFDD